MPMSAWKALSVLLDQLRGLEVRSAGGGGWGPPERRTRQARQRDEVQGLVTSGATTEMVK